MPKFKKLGIPADAAESRTGAVCTNADGESRVVIAAKGFVLIVDPYSDKSIQVPFPDGNRNYPYLCCSDSQGRFYTGAGPVFMMLDPFLEQFVYSEAVGREGELVGFGFAEDSQGMVYFTAYPTCRLFRFNPDSLMAEDLGRLDSDQQYPGYAAVDRCGWLYAGIGTEKKALAAYHLESGRLKQLIPAVERMRGSGYVHQGRDGNVYAHWEYTDLRASGGNDAQERYRWMKLEGGEAMPVPYSEVSPSSYHGEGFFRIHRQLPGELTAVSHDLAERELIVASRDGSGRRRIGLHYTCEGAQLSPLTAGPDGHIYGTSNHPLHLFRYDPEHSQLTDYGGKVIEQGGGGNLCAYAVSGNWIGAAAYAGGHLHLLDVTRPIAEERPRRNPQRVASHAEIFRPRSALAHSDGVHMIFGGFPGYGAVGGGLCIYNLDSEEDVLLVNEQLVPYHSTTCLVESAEGNLVGGTSIEAPGGAAPKETAAKLYLLEWKTRQVIRTWTPVEGARELVWIDRDTEGRIHGLTSSSVYFVYDLEQDERLHQQDLSEWGRPVRSGIVRGLGEERFGVLSGAVYTVDFSSWRAVRLAEPAEEITAGLAFHNNILYMGMGSSLWSYTLGDGEGGTDENEL